MHESIPQADLEAFFDELLPATDMVRIERALREDPRLTRRAQEIHARRGAGVFSLGEAWRRAGASCPSRERLGSFLMGAVSGDEADYIDFHLTVVGCRCCQANLADLESRQADAPTATATRRRKYFQSSVGYLREH